MKQSTEAVSNGAQSSKKPRTVTAPRVAQRTQAIQPAAPLVPAQALGNDILYKLDIADEARTFKPYEEIIKAALPDKTATVFECVRHGDLHPRIRRAVHHLLIVTFNAHDEIGDCIGCDPREDIQALCAALELCRAALDTIEATAREVVAEEKVYVAGRMAELEEFGDF